MKEVVDKANADFSKVWDMSIPAERIRGIKEFNVDEPAVVEHGGMKSYPLKFLEFSGATTDPEEVGGVVSWRKIWKGKPNKECGELYRDCVAAMNKYIAWMGTEFLIPSKRRTKRMKRVKDVCEGEHLKRFYDAAGFKLDIVYEQMVESPQQEDPEDLFKSRNTGCRASVCQWCESKDHQAQVVEVQFRKVRVRKGEWQVFGRIVKFFMHNVDCKRDGPPEERFRVPCQGILESGPNWVKMKCALDKIYGLHLEKLVERVKEWDVTKPLSPGHKIRFQTKGVEGEIEADSQHYAPVPSMQDWWKDLCSPLEARDDGIRHMVFVAQWMGAAQDVALHGPRQEWPAPELHGFLKDKGLEDEKAAGGAFLGISLIFAGLPKIPRGDTYDKHLKGHESLATVNQPWHADMQNMVVDEVSHDVMTNPRTEKTTPGLEWLAAVQDKREIGIRGNNGLPVTVEVKVGKMLLWGGSADHRGMGISKEDLEANQSLHAALHGCYENFGHPWVSNDVALNIEAMRGDSVEHIGRLDKKERIKQFNALADSTRKVVHGVCRSNGKLDPEFKVAVQECFEGISISIKLCPPVLPH